MLSEASVAYSGADDFAAQFAGESGLILLPDVLSEVDGQRVAAFREGSQALRVSALERGVPVVLAMPAGSVPGQYSEHAADWVLPLMLNLSSSVAGGLLANYLQAKLDAWKGNGSGSREVPTVKHREVTVRPDGTPATMRVLEGPADELIRWYREVRALETVEWDWPTDD